MAGREGRYEFGLTVNACSLAVLCFEHDTPLVGLYRFPASELPFLRHACGPPGQPST